MLADAVNVLIILCIFGHTAASGQKLFMLYLFRHVFWLEIIEVAFVYDIYMRNKQKRFLNFHLRVHA